MYKVELDGNIVKGIFHSSNLPTGHESFTQVDEDDTHFSLRQAEYAAIVGIHDVNKVKKIAVWNGGTKVIEEAATTSDEYRDSKIDLLRDLRAEKLTEADIETNKAYDSGTDIAAWKTYRQALRDVTDAYKDHATNGSQATALDAADWDSFTWPTKP